MGLAAPLRALRPEATGLLDVACARAWDAVDAELLDALRTRAAVLLGHPDGRRVDAADPAVASCLEFAEQFVLDVSGIGEAERDALAPARGRGRGHRRRPGAVPGRVRAAAGARVRPALRRPRRRGARPGHRRPADACTALREALADYQDAVVRGDALDPVLTELVRLRCARTHNCRICQTLRLADARDAGADDAVTAAVDRYETSDLDERTKAALRITDALITMPASLSPEAAAAARALLTAGRARRAVPGRVEVEHAEGARGARAPTRPTACRSATRGVSWFRFDGDGRVAGFSARPDPG